MDTSQPSNFMEIDRLARIADKLSPSGWATPAKLEEILKRESKLPYSAELQIAVFKRMMSIYA